MNDALIPSSLACKSLTDRQLIGLYSSVLRAQNTAVFVRKVVLHSTELNFLLFGSTSSLLRIKSFALRLSLYKVGRKVNHICFAFMMLLT